MKIFLALMLVLVIFTAVPSCGDLARDKVCVPVFMYHHIAQGGDAYTTVDPDTFEYHVKTMLEAGYTAVSFEQLVDFVDSGTSLPEKPVCIVFDDGYLSNYLYAFPVLRRYGMCATVSVIGSSAGAFEHDLAGTPVIPHFSWEQAREMHASGLVNFASHTYGMHMNAGLGTIGGRQYCARLPFETADSFISALVYDSELMSAAMNDGIGRAPDVFAYPHGVWDAFAENTLRALGYRVTLISESGVNTVVRGEPDSLYLLRRYNITQADDINKIIESVARFTD